LQTCKDIYDKMAQEAEKIQEINDIVLDSCIKLRTHIKAKANRNLRLLENFKDIVFSKITKVFDDFKNAYENDMQISDQLIATKIQEISSKMNSVKSKIRDSKNSEIKELQEELSELQKDRTDSKLISCKIEERFKSNSSLSIFELPPKILKKNTEYTIQVNYENSESSLQIIDSDQNIVFHTMLKCQPEQIPSLVIKNSTVSVSCVFPSADILSRFTIAEPETTYLILAMYSEEDTSFKPFKFDIENADLDVKFQEIRPKDRAKDISQQVEMMVQEAEEKLKKVNGFKRKNSI
jgi:hypothetical protein